MSAPRIAAAAAPLLALFAFGCAHPQSVTLTSASAAVPAATPAAPAPAPAAITQPPTVEATDRAPAPKDKDAKAEKKSDDAGEMSFAALSASLGDDKMALDGDHVGNGTTVAREGRGLSADNYTAFGGVHEAVPESRTNAGDVKVSGGITVASVRDTVRGANDRLRVCYERGLANAPHLAGRVTVSFTVDERGNVGDVDAESDLLPNDVTGCVADVFTGLTFATPKNPPAKIVYPIAFQKN